MQGETPAPEGAEILFFHPATSATLGAQLESGGRFHLEIADPRIGIPIGSYKVVVRPPPPEPLDPQSEAYKARMLGQASPVPSKTPIPERVQALQTTPIRQEIQAGENHVLLDLSKYEP